MIYTIRGKPTLRGDNFFVAESGGIGFKVFTNRRTVSELPKSGAEVLVFCFLYLREDQAELYGFLEEESLKLFEMLNTVGGIGPKTALGILDVTTVPRIMAAIIEKKIDLLTRASGIGRKTAERIILELRGRLSLKESAETARLMETDVDLEEALVSLGYPRGRAKEAIREIDPKTKALEERLKEALKRIKQ